MSRERLLGRTPGGDDVVGCKLKVDWLERNVPAIDDDSDEESVQRYVRSYILQLIGGCLFADKSNRFVHLMFLPLLEDFQLAGQYSWGSACLAYLYKELCRGSRAGAHEVAGASILIQLWAWDIFPFIAPRRLRVSRAQPRMVDGQNMLMDVPLGYIWLDAFSVSQSATHVVSAYRDALDSQRHDDDVVWQPYTELMGSLPDFCTNGHGSWLSTCPLICFHIVEWHRPERVMRQFGMVQVVPPNCAYDAQLHLLELRGHHHENWVTFHASYIHMWENRGDTIATTTLNEGHDHKEYMTWYRSVTRRFIGHDVALRDYSVISYLFIFLEHPISYIACFDLLYFVYQRNLVHRLRRVFIKDGYEQGLAALDEGIKILDEDERQRSNISHDGNDVEQGINEDIEQEDEEDDQGEPNIEVRRRRTRPETVRERTRRPRPPRPSNQTEIAAESSRRSPPARTSRSRVSKTETVGESSQQSSPPTHSSHGYIPASSTPQAEPQMFVPRPPSVNLRAVVFICGPWNASSSNVSVTASIHA
ncbi:hypothetical protein Scep_011757 [Stephania cephalantha]|uniref:Aminotransferase-like plant mobile domain-containing protein n=1 Tax=Stephania cephalantha TaxID=152367 RepID=A0AAP0JE00_9MAGN